MLGPDAVAPPRRATRLILQSAGGALAAGALVWLLRGIDLARFLALLAQASLPFVLLVPGSILLEQWLRAWKWRQVLWDLRRVPAWRLFRATMAGYIPGMLVGFGTSALARSWLVARRSAVPTGTVLATAAVDRFIDLLAFAVLTGLAAALVALPVPDSALLRGLRWSGVALAALGFVAFAGLTVVRRGGLQRLATICPPRFRNALRRGLAELALGITWPRSRPRRAAIIAAALLVKAVAATQYLWAGLAFDVRLPIGNYLFLTALLGTLVLVGFFVRIPGSGLLASMFALELLGVPRAQALAITVTVVSSYMLTIVVAGGAALAGEGMSLATLRAAMRDPGPV